MTLPVRLEVANWLIVMLGVGVSVRTSDVVCVVVAAVEPLCVAERVCDCVEDEACEGVTARLGDCVSLGDNSWLPDCI